MTFSSWKKDENTIEMSYLNSNLILESAESSIIHNGGKISDERWIL